MNFLKNEDWLPIALEESWEVTEKDYKDDPKGLLVYNQFLIDKKFYTYITYVDRRGRIGLSF